jgi:HAD superfamily hydrolase (TIGR01490 family)
VSGSDTEMDEAGGMRVGAFFDVDRTLIEVNSGRIWVEYLWRQNKISIPYAMRSAWWLAKYWLSALDYDQVTAEVVRAYAGQSVEELESEVRAWFDEEIAPTICREAREAVEKHRKLGHVLVVLTSGSQFSTKPLQEELGIDHLVCTEVEVADGVLTGEYFPPTAYGEGKLTRAREFAERENIDLSRSFFYTDSYSDRPMLDAVGNPRVVNPDPRLKRFAIAKGWGFDRWSA